MTDCTERHLAARARRRTGVGQKGMPEGGTA
jgi:hypothetical protein